ncbi:hypothetical protein ALI144C_31905 [Actinosynnema sp. ALI-1.44]|nr:hypothetical protein ALI144C_31905 [Actinosynnema sp. ALI-1.44]
MVDAGHSVALAAPNLDQQSGDFGRLLRIQSDIASPAEVDDVFHAVERRMGVVDILFVRVARAVAGPLLATADTEWDLLLDAGLGVPFRCIRRAVPGMAGRGWGRIVIMSSECGTFARNATAGLVRSVASELSGTGVTVNAVFSADAGDPACVVDVAELLVHSPGISGEFLTVDSAGIRATA